MEAWSFTYLEGSKEVLHWKWYPHPTRFGNLTFTYYEINLQLHLQEQEVYSYKKITTFLIRYFCRSCTVIALILQIIFLSDWPLNLKHPDRGPDKTHCWPSFYFTLVFHPRNWNPIRKVLSKWIMRTDGLKFRKQGFVTCLKKYTGTLI